MRTDPRLLAVARGDAPADLLLRGGRIVNVFTRTVAPGSIAVAGTRIASVGPDVDAVETVDLDGAYVAPGFIDAHMHVESTMLLPAEFARIAAPHGTTAAVLDPHEIANVAGLEGIRFLMDCARDVPMTLLFAASSCVPASPLETSGAELGVAELAALLEDERVIALAEMMNFPGVVGGDPDVLAKVRLGLEHGLVDGHCPGLRGAALQAYVAAGISSDHECTTADEAREKIALGMTVYLREGSAARNLEALLPAVEPHTAHRFCFCTDDRHPGDLIEEGHIDHVVRRAVALGLDPLTALAMASLHAAQHYGLHDLGAIAPGRRADLVVFETLQDIRMTRVYRHGRACPALGRYETPAAASSTLAAAVRLPETLDFRVPAAAASSIRVIGMRHRIDTEDLRMPPAVADGMYVADPSRDLLKMAVIERHRGTGNVGIGFVHGFGLERGAIASTVAHDSHNLSVVGADDRDMEVAARALAEAGGGQCAAADGVVLALLPLPIAGLLSPEPAPVIVEQQAALHAAARAIGCPLHDPFMPLSFLSLTVIPKLKLSDLGLVDVDRFEVVPLGE